jgi:glucose-6-phosphate isomerase
MTANTASRETAWEAMMTAGAMDGPSLIEMFKAAPSRAQDMTLSVGGITADFSKQRLESESLKTLFDLARACDLDGWRDKLFGGAKINTSEDRAVLHMTLRGVGGSAAAQKQVADMRVHMREFANSIRSEGHFKAIVHIGIGGSDLGPRLIADAFAATGTAALDLRFAENIDGASINDALEGLDPKTTLVIVVSKSFGTQETKMNGEAAREWLGGHASDNMIAVSANNKGAQEFGIAPDRIFDFWDWVGGRYSVWSAVGLSLQIAFGPDMFDAFLAGAKLMDEHFRDAPLEQNMPAMMAMIGIWNRNGLGYASQAVIPYARRIRKLPAFLQQLEMESNGKGIGRDGKPAGLTCPVIWGDEGTNSQHAFFQWLHQAFPGAPVDFVAVLHDHSERPAHHKTLLANCFAQSEALMVGKAEAVVREQMQGDKNIDALAPQKTFYGNRPSTTLLLESLNPKTLGSLIALYEHKTFTQGVIWGVNSFDQWGVQLGKVLATTIEAELGGAVGEHDSSTLALIERAKAVL